MSVGTAPAGAGEPRPQLQRWHDSEGAVWAICEHDEPVSRLELVDFGQFLLDRRTGRISGEPLPSVEITVAVRRFWKEAVPMLHQANGGLVLHASAVSTPGGAVLLVGESGAGKSTLARAWSSRKGNRQLADDVSVLYPGRDGGHEVHPLPFYTNVWGSIRGEVAKPDLEVTETGDRVRVAGLVLVEPTEAARPHWRAPTVEVFLTLLAESWCFSLSDDASRQQFYSQNLELVDSTPWRRLAYPHRLNMLQESLDLLSGLDFS